MIPKSAQGRPDAQQIKVVRVGGARASMVAPENEEWDNICPYLHQGLAGHRAGVHHLPGVALDAVIVHTQALGRWLWRPTRGQLIQVAARYGTFA